MIQTTAIVLIWVYVAAFLLLTAVAARRSGKRIWLFSVGRERQTLPAMLFRTAFILGCVLPLISVWIDPGWPAGLIHPFGVSTMVAATGLLLMTLGTAVALYAQWHMGNSWRIGAADGMQGSMISGGPFAYSRNPVFVGQISLFAGWLSFTQACRRWPCSYASPPPSISRFVSKNVFWNMT